MSDRNFDRRTFIRRAGALGAVGAGGGGLSSLLAACGSSSQTAATGGATPGKPVAGGRAVLATVDKPVNMDAADGQLYSSIQVYQNIYASLLYINENFGFEPGLAASWTQDDEQDLDARAGRQRGLAQRRAVHRRRRRVHLRALQGAPDSAPSPPPSSAPSRWARTRCGCTWRQPYGALEPLLAGLVSIMNEKAVKSADPKLKPIGCGPYRMKEWVQDDHVTLEKWDKYFKPDMPHLDEIVFRAVGDDSVRLTGLQTGELTGPSACRRSASTSSSTSSELASLPSGVRTTRT